MPETEVVKAVVKAEEVDRQVTIDGKEYTVSPLRCKHLRQISKILKNKEAQSIQDFSSVERWMPFVLDSLKTLHSEFTQDQLDEMTLQEFNDTWEKIVAISGVQLTGKGETKPAAKSNGIESSPDLPPAAPGVTVQ